MGISFWHIVIVLVVVLLLFGAGKIPRLMKDLGSGITAFKKGLKENEGQGEQPPAAQPAAGGKPALDEGAYEEELRKAILTSQPVGPAEFQALGEARAASVQGGLVQQAGLDASRVEMGAPRAATGSGGTRVRLPLEIAGAGPTAPASKAAQTGSVAPSSPRSPNAPPPDQNPRP